VSAQSIPRLLTVEEFEKIPDPPGGRFELRHGEAVFVTWPVRQHKDLQYHVRKLLEPMAEPRGFRVYEEYPYRPFPENEVWGADVVCIAESRHQQVEKWLVGSPELVIEVTPPSNTKAELHDKAMTTLAGAGAVEFWIVDAKTRSVTVFTAGGMHLYDGDMAVPVAMFGAQILLTDLFASVA
jgi:Uma2 family endonuclease